ncbi:hypothetical protein [Achromobacter dolens]|uniref:hypothetical protein n=1 Tax=Achromobacter dolens TaxID=1287738 RepID=UPI00119E4B25|nr:hypothetical protein [Achromobacter dolens]
MEKLNKLGRPRMEIIGVILAILGLIFAFERPRKEFLALFGILGPLPLSEHDQALVKEFRALFADSGLFRLYKNHDFLLPLSQRATSPLYTVVETWIDEAHFFVNSDLRAKQFIFIKAAKELAEEIIRYTVPDGNGNITVISRHMDPENLPPHVLDEAKAIDAKLPAFLQAHEDLLTKCKDLT